jgi:dipeptidase E
MRLYLSSFRVGDRGDLLVAMAGQGARAAVIANSMDDAPTDHRRQAVELELAALADLGLRPSEVDLRDHVGDAAGVAAALDGYDVLWLRGGNVFMLRQALRHSGADDAIVAGLARDAFVYAGYSAGPCVLAPSLRGLEIVDDAHAVTRVYGEPPIWEGLDVLDFAFVPHVASPDHPESEAMYAVVERYRAGGVPHRTLRDGQVLVVDGDRTTLY